MFFQCSRCLIGTRSGTIAFRCYRHLLAHCPQKAITKPLAWNCFVSWIKKKDLYKKYWNFAMRSGDNRSRNANSKLGFTEKCTLRWQIRLKNTCCKLGFTEMRCKYTFFLWITQNSTKFFTKTFPKTPIQMQKMARLFHFKKKITAWNII